MSPYHLDVLNNIIEKRTISVVAAFFEIPEKIHVIYSSSVAYYVLLRVFLAAAVSMNFAHLVKRTKVSTQNRLNNIMHPEFDQNGSF